MGCSLWLELDKSGMIVAGMSSIGNEMNIMHPVLGRGRAQWRDIADFPQDVLPAVARDWLGSTDSLTNRLRQATQQKVEFRLVQADWGPVTEEEAQLLNIDAKVLHWVRQIEWRYQGQLWVAARVVIPRCAKSSKAKALCQVGGRSIGEVLFADHLFQRGQISVSCLSKSHFYTTLVGGEVQGELWARRSLFCCLGDQILVSEIFLPAFFTDIV